MIAPDIVPALVAVICAVTPWQATSRADRFSHVSGSREDGQRSEREFSLELLTAVTTVTVCPQTPVASYLLTVHYIDDETAERRAHADMERIGGALYTAHTEASDIQLVEVGAISLDIGDTEQQLEASREVRVTYRYTPE